jgi:glycosyltransferase involved in cell wall biosynthesis
MRSLIQRLAVQVKRSETLRRIVVPLMMRFPPLRRRLVALANGTYGPSGDITHPDWPAPLPAAYLQMPLATRKILLDLARTAQPAQTQPVAPIPARPRLAWVAPAAPDAALRAELAQRYEIDHITPGADTEGARSIAWFEQHHAAFDRVLYHVANTAAHGPILQLLARHPGIVVLHDFALGQAIDAIAPGDALQQALFDGHGYSALVACQRAGRAAALATFPLNRAVFDQATGVIAPSAHMQALARAWNGPRSAQRWQVADSQAPQRFADAVEEIARHGPAAQYRQSLRDLAGTGSPDPRDRALIAAATALAAQQPADGPRQLLVDISALVQADLKTGVQRVVRSILLALINDPPAGYRVEPVYSTNIHQCYRYARRYGLDLVGAPDVAGDDDPVAYQAGDIFLGLDMALSITVNNTGLLDTMRALGVAVYFVVYDMLPVLQPHAFPYGAAQYFKAYLDTLTGHADGVLCISRAVADELIDWIGQHGAARDTPLKIGHFHLGADLDASAPSTGMPGDAMHVLAALAARPSLLMVGTLEPRKAHAQALAAFDLLWQRGVDVNLVMVGKLGWQVDAVAAALRAHPRFGKQLFWLTGASDELLGESYRLAAALLAPSLGEGFGLPLIEAAQHGLPIIARGLPVFREVAGEHAFYFDGTEPAQLADAVEAWLALFRHGQAPASTAMPWLTWAQSAGQVQEAIVHDRWYRRL